MATSDHELDIPSSTFIPPPIHARFFQELLVIHRSGNPTLLESSHLRKKTDSNRLAIAVRFTILDSLLRDFDVLHLAAEVYFFNLIAIHNDRSGLCLSALILPLDGCFGDNFSIP
jgi:hypothetical protein